MGLPEGYHLDAPTPQLGSQGKKPAVEVDPGVSVPIPEGRERNKKK